MGIIEFGFLYNNLLTVQFAARQGVSGGGRGRRRRTAPTAPILKAVEQVSRVPVDRTKVTQVEIFESDANGDPVPDRTQYAMSGPGSLDCGGDHRAIHARGHRGLSADRAPRQPGCGPRRGRRPDRLPIPGHHAGRVRPHMDVSDGATLRMEPKQ